jgi:hypothetical protein
MENVLTNGLVLIVTIKLALLPQDVSWVHVEHDAARSVRALTDKHTAEGQQHNNASNDAYGASFKMV